MIFKFTDNFIFFKKKIHQSFAEFKNCTTFASAIKQYGRLAQLVQSIWFTPRGSGVRIPQRPQKRFKRTSFFIAPYFSREPSFGGGTMNFSDTLKHTAEVINTNNKSQRN